MDALCHKSEIRESGIFLWEGVDGVRLFCPTGHLLAGYANKHGTPEVKVQTEFNDGPKPISAPVCMFATKLRPEDH